MRRSSDTAEGVTRGPRVGRYVLLREIGRGGHGRVFLALDNEGTRVAVKVLSSCPGRDATRWRAEAAAGARIDHAHVVRTLDAGLDATVPWLAQEWIPGGSLRQLFVRRGRLAEPEVRRLALHAAKGLAAIHAAGVVHHDLKPENLLLGPGRVLKVGDFGLASLRTGAASPDEPQTGAGTVAYAAPEQLAGPSSRVDGRADLYSLGVVFFEALAGGAALVDRRSAGSGEVSRLRTVAPATSAFFDELCASLLRRRPEDRLATAEELCEALRGAELSRWWRARRRAGVTAELSARRPWTQRTVGRRRELRQLRTAWERAASGARCAVAIVGEAGSGKTHLVDDVLCLARGASSGVVVVGGEYLPGAEQGTLVPIVQSLLDLAAADERARACLPDADVAGPGASDAETESWVRRAIAALSRLAPVTVVVEDLHFAPASTEGAIARLAAAWARERVLVLATSRVTECLPASFGRVALGPWQRHDLRHVLTQALDSRPAADRLVDEILEATGGNPFLTFQALDHLRDRGDIVRLPEGAWTVRSARVVASLPANAGLLLEARLRELPASDQRLLETAACSGELWSASLLAACLERPEREVHGRLDDLATRQGLVTEHAAAAWRFRHRYLRDAVVSRIGPARRRALHARVARALVRLRAPGSQIPAGPSVGAADLCERWLDAGRPADAEGALDAALGELTGAFDSRRASALIRRVLDDARALSDERRLDLLSRRFLLARQFDPAETLLADVEKSAELATRRGDALELLRSRGAKADLLLQVGRRDVALVEARRLLDDVRPDMPPKLIVQAAYTAAFAAYTLGRLDESLEAIARGLAFAPEVSRERAQFRLLRFNALCDAMRNEEAGRELADSRAIVEALGTPIELAAWHHSNAAWLWRKGDFDGAIEAARRCVDVAERAGAVTAALRARVRLAEVLVDAGRFEECAPEAETMRALLPVTRDQVMEPFVDRVEACVARGRGEYGTAIRLLRRMLRRAEELRDTNSVVTALTDLAATLAELGLFQDAQRFVDRAREVAGPTDNPEFNLATASAAGRVAALEGKLDDARKYLASGLALAPHLAFALDDALELVWHEIRADELRRARSTLARVLRARRQTESTVPALLAACVARLSPRRRGRALSDCLHTLDRTSCATRLRVRWLLWEMTGEPGHLADAAQWLERVVDHAPHQAREGLAARVPLYRDVLAAAAARLRPARAT